MSDQSLAGQLDALHEAGCDRVWSDVASGVRTRRPGLDDLVAVAAPGDTVVTTRLDRLGRSLPLMDRSEMLCGQFSAEN
jgi:DNA invertase Pin-like site-specific DNA recombinase